METAHTETLERIARILAGQALSANANGASRSAAEAVDDSWRCYLKDATALLNALREPDERMVAVGDGDTWTRMVRAALGEDLGDLRRERLSFADHDETYQKPWG